MKNSILQYELDGDKRYIHISSLRDLYAYVYAETLQYLNGVLALRDIQGELKREDFSIDVLIEEVIDCFGVTQETFAIYNNEKIKLEGLELL